MGNELIIFEGNTISNSHPNTRSIISQQLGRKSKNKKLQMVDCHCHYHSFQRKVLMFVPKRTKRCRLGSKKGKKNKMTMESILIKSVAREQKTVPRIKRFKTSCSRSWRNTRKGYEKSMPKSETACTTISNDTKQPFMKTYEKKRKSYNQRWYYDWLIESRINPFLYCVLFQTLYYVSTLMDGIYIGTFIIIIILYYNLLIQE